MTCVLRIQCFKSPQGRSNCVVFANLKIRHTSRAQIPVSCESRPLDYALIVLWPRECMNGDKLLKRVWSGSRSRIGQEEGRGMIRPYAVQPQNRAEGGKTTKKKPYVVPCPEFYGVQRWPKAHLAVLSCCVGVECRADKGAWDRDQDGRTSDGSYPTFLFWVTSLSSSVDIAFRVATHWCHLRSLSLFSFCTKCFLSLLFLISFTRILARPTFWSELKTESSTNQEPGWFSWR